VSKIIPLLFIKLHSDKSHCTSVLHFKENVKPNCLPYLICKSCQFAKGKRLETNHKQILDVKPTVTINVSFTVHTK